MKRPELIEERDVVSGVVRYHYFALWPDGTRVDLAPWGNALDVYLSESATLP